MYIRKLPGSCLIPRTCSHQPANFITVIAAIFCLCLAVNSSQAAGRQSLHGHVPASVSRSSPTGRVASSTKLDLVIGLPLRNKEELTNLLQQIYDPSSPQYRHYLSPDEFAARFGPTESDYQALIAFAVSNNFTVTGTHPNRTLLHVKASASDIERTFHTTLRTYRHPTEAREFFAPEGDTSLDIQIPVIDVTGLDNYAVPKPMNRPTQAALASAIPASGSGSSGTYAGKDFRGAYAPGVSLTGAGQSVGLIEFDSGFYNTDITNYETTYPNIYGLPNVPLVTVAIDGLDGSPGANNVEVALDIEMAVAMAPGLNSVVIYEGTSGNDLMNRMATDNTCKQLSASWTQYAGGASSDQIWQQMAAQGQSFFTASGDNGAYVGAPAAPTDDPYITVVGGTTLSTTGPGGSWTTEQVWNWNTTGGGTDAGGGGISTTIPIPIWQQGISMANNQGSTTFRNLPDVAMTANAVWVISTGHTGSYGGTSCATPLWAAYAALINQQASANGWPYLGFLNPAVYNIGKGPNYTSAFHDIVIGNDTNAASPTHYFSATGYDLCTGWGTPTGNALINALILPPLFAVNPPNDQHNTGFQPVLVWGKSSSNAFQSGDLYFDTNYLSVASATTNSPQYLGRLTATNYALPGLLATNTIYYWRVDRVTSSNTVVPGAVWSFTTAPDSIHADLRMHLTLDGRDTIAPTTYDLGGPPFKDATMNNNPPFVPGVVNQGMSFNGTNQFLAAPALGLYTSNATFLAWIKRNGTPNNFSGLVFCRSSSTISGLSLHNTGALTYAWNGDVNTSNFASGLTVPNAQWTLVGLVVTPTQATIYMGQTNGTLSSATHTYNHVPQLFDGLTDIAWDPAATNRYFNGSLDEIGVWRRALSTAEIGQILTNGINGVTLDGSASSPVPGTFTWTGASDNTWTNPANWSSGATPGSSNIVVFDSSSLSNLSTHLTTSFFVSGILVDGALRAVAITNAPGGSLVIGPDGVNLSNCYTSLTLNATVFTTAAQTWTIPADASVNVVTNIIKAGIPITFSNNGSLKTTGVISGAGGLNFFGTGSNFLGGSSIYSGTTTLGGGIVVAGSSGAFGATTSIVVSNGATVDLDGNSLSGKPLTVQGTGLNGFGTIINNGAQQLSAINELILAGDTSINSGGQGWNFAPGTGSTTFQGNGFGLTKIGSSSIWIQNSGDTGLGNIFINQGLLGFQGTSGMGLASNTVTVAPGAVLGFSAPTVSLNKAVSLADGAGISTISGAIFSGPVTLNGNGIMAPAGQLTLGGVLGGPGFITVAGSGTLILNNSGNNWTGGSILNSGTLSIGNDSYLGAVPASLAPSNIVINGGVLLASTSFGLNANRGIVVGPTSGTGNGIVDVSGAGNTLTVNGPIANNGTGSNSLTKIDTGILALGGADTYSGDTIISAGTLQTLLDGAIPRGPGRGNVSVQTNGTLNLNGVSVGINALNGSGLVDAGSGSPTLTIGNNNATGSFSGTLTNSSGTLNLLKTGSGIQALTGPNAYSGTTTVSQGTLQLQHDALLHLSFDSVSGIGNGATVTNTGTGGAAMNGVITGTGAAIVGGGRFGNALSLNGTGSSVRIANAVTLLDGNVTGEGWTVAAWLKTSLAGAILAYQGAGSWASGNTTFYLNQGNSTAGTRIGAVRYAGGWLTGNSAVNDTNWHFVAITCNSGVKSVYVDGNLDASFPGTTWPNASTGNQVWLGASPDTTDGDASMNGMIDEFYMFNRALNQSEVQSLLVSNTLPGQAILPATTDVSVASGATLDLGGTTEIINSLSGPAGGTVKLGTASPGSLTINSQLSAVFTGAITGVGSLTETGTATQSLNGNNIFSGPTTITSGTLLVNGLLGSSSVTVTGGALGGTGVITGPVAVQPSGTLAPGNPAGTLTVSNSLALAGTVLLAINNSVPGYNTVSVTGALSLGGSLIVTNLGPALALGNSFQLFTAGSFSGSFSNVSLPAPPVGAVWDTSTLATAGFIQLVTPPPPQILPVVLTGNSFNLQVPTQPGMNYVLQAASSLVAPIVWTNISTNLGDGNTLSLPMTVDPAAGQNFYRFMVY